MSIDYLLTFQDLIDRLVAYAGGGALDADHPDILAAAQDGYFEVIHGGDWGYLKGKGRVALNAAYQTGTIAFDLTGGAYERVLTLTGGTWPSWASYGTVKINELIYTVEDRKSSTELTLAATACPSADITAGTSYQIWQSQYDLPSTFRRLREVYIDGETWRLAEIEPTEWLAYETMESTAGTPNYFSIFGSDDSAGRLSMHLAPYPDEAKVLVFMFERTARPLFYRGYETESRVGTVSGSAGSTTVTGSSTTFHSSMVGSMIRFSRNTASFPTGRYGINPFLEQAQIKAVNSATSLTLTEPLSYTHAALTKYAISDYVDVAPFMQNAVLRAAENSLDQARNPKRAANTFQRYRLAVIQARERNGTVSGKTSPFTEFVFMDRGFNSPLLPGQG